MNYPCACSASCAFSLYLLQQPAWHTLPGPPCQKQRQFIEVCPLTYIRPQGVFRYCPRTCSALCACSIICNTWVMSYNSQPGKPYLGHPVKNRDNLLRYVLYHKSGRASIIKFTVMCHRCQLSSIMGHVCPYSWWLVKCVTVISASAVLISVSGGEWSQRTGT